MKRFALVLALTASALGGCGSDSQDKLLGGGTSNTGDPDSLVGGGTSFNHPAEPNSGDNGISDPVAVKALEAQIGTPEVVARLHGCTKVTVRSLRNMLVTRGVDMTAPTGGGGGGGLPRDDDKDGNGGGNNAPQPTDAAGLFFEGQAALGAANYGGRIPEALFASTSAMAKQFDIYVAASSEIATNYAQATGCTGTTLLNGNNLTREGISCLIGKPATDEHVTLANNLVASAADPQAGQRIAIAALLQAAHTCE